MSEAKKSKTAGMFVTVFIGLIILTFMFTGYQSFDGGAGGVANVGSVGGEPIKPEEYNLEYQRQLEFYKQIYGADMTAKQIEQLNLKDAVIKNIVQRKIMVKFAKDLGTFPSIEQVKAEIKEFPYFKTNGQFDINLYKRLLQANNLTPLEYEEDIINQIRMKEVAELTTHYPLSKGYLADLAKFREEKVNAETVTITKNSLNQFVVVSNEELAKFMAIETNQKRVESMFKERQASLDKPAEVTARHILIASQGKVDADIKTQIEKIASEVTPANFVAMANKYTEDPSGKGKGGELKSFSKGQMVPEFEEVAFSQKPGTISAPVKTAYGYHIILVEKKTEALPARLADYSDKFAREIIQKDKVEDLKALTVSVATELRKAMEDGNESQVKSLVAKYKLEYNQGSINRIDGAEAGTSLSSDNMKAIFSGDLTKPQFHSFDDGANLVMIRTTPTVVASDVKANDKLVGDTSNLQSTLAKKMMDNILKEIEANTRVKINQNAIRM